MFGPAPTAVGLRLIVCSLQQQHIFHGGAMDGYQDYGLWWAGVVILFAITFIIAMILRNKAAKTDSVNHTKADAELNSITPEPPNNKPNKQTQ